MEHHIDDVKRGITVFRKLHEQYGLAIPRMELVIGKSIGKKVMFTVTDRIYGKSIVDTKRLPETAFPKMSAFLEGES